MTKASLQSIPFIPEDAPFNTEQRAWLNGFLAGLFSNAPSMPTASASAAFHVSVFFATQGGTAERLAKKFVKELKSSGHTATLQSLGDVTPAQVAVQERAFFFVSTYGDGEAPDSARNFRDALLGPETPSMSGLRYSVFALGDSSYEQFCAFGKELDERLGVLGGTRIVSRTDSDVDVERPFATWKAACLATLTSAAQTPSSTSPSIQEARKELPVVRYSRESPYAAEIVARHALTGDKSGKLTIHLALRLADDLHYEAGDACGVVAQNDSALVDEILSLLGFSADEWLEVPKIGTCTVRDALLNHYQHTRLTRKMVQTFAELTQCRVLSSLLPAEQAAHLEAFMYDRGLIDLLIAYPGAVDSAATLLSFLPRLSPRLYSISSSPARHGRELHCTIGVVRYRSHDRNRGGVASTMLADRLTAGDTVPIYIQPNKKFRLPADTSAPIILIGPGTGIAPFRSFLHEREALRHRGRNWLFFGERREATDFLYCRELRAMCDSGHLARLDTAFSRDQEQKIYVQDRMLEQGSSFWEWLDEGASVYVCGDASRMAKDVDAALHSLIEKHGRMSVEAAREYVAKMHEDGRYHRDVY